MSKRNYPRNFFWYLLTFRQMPFKTKTNHAEFRLHSISPIIVPRTLADHAHEARMNQHPLLYLYSQYAKSTSS